jgi:predicted ester cyclase
MTTQPDLAAQARGAIEIVCSGDLSRMEEFYSPDFVDHVNDTTLHGYEGGRESVGFYRAIFRDLRMGVDDQVTEGDRVASRWRLMGKYHGRPVTLRGITISRFGEDGRILEDHAHSDTISLARQIGIARTLILALEVLTRRAKLPKGSLQRS